MWWTQAGSLVVGVLGLVISANWVFSGTWRRLRSLKAHAELLALLPEQTPARVLLSKHLDMAVARHLIELENPKTRRWLMASNGLTLLGIVTGAGTFGLGAFGLVARDEPGWVLPLQATALVIAVAATLGVRWAVRMTSAEIERMRKQYAVDAPPSADRQP